MWVLIRAVTYATLFIGFVAQRQLVLCTPLPHYWTLPPAIDGNHTLFCLVSGGSR